MIRLLKIELQKIIPYLPFKILLALFIALPALIYYAAGDATITIQNREVGLQGKEFPNLWYYLTLAMSFYHLLLGVIVMMLVTNESGFRTLRQNIIDGLSRTEILSSKLLVIATLSLVATLWTFICGIAFGIANTDALTLGMITEKLHFLAAYWLQSIGYMTAALFVGLTIQKPLFSIGLYILFALPIETVVGLALNYVFKTDLWQFLPFTAFFDIIDFTFEQLVKQFMGAQAIGDPSTSAIAITIGYIGAFIALSYWRLQKSNV